LQNNVCADIEFIAVVLEKLVQANICIEYVCSYLRDNNFEILYVLKNKCSIKFLYKKNIYVIMYVACKNNFSCDITDVLLQKDFNVDSIAYKIPGIIYELPAKNKFFPQLVGINDFNNKILSTNISVEKLFARNPKKILQAISACVEFDFSTIIQKEIVVKLLRKMFACNFVKSMKLLQETRHLQKLIDQYDLKITVN
jgi:hypothetical protein